MALREQRVGGGMDSDLLATFGDLPNGNSSSSKEVGHSPLRTTASMGGFPDEDYINRSQSNNERVVCLPHGLGSLLH